MDERKQRILRAIIEDYVKSAEPVGSRTIAKNYDLGISPATVRNEMSDLEELGYLEQPHTSAGRIPSAKGYRLYVDSMLSRQPVPLQDAEKIEMLWKRSNGSTSELFLNMAKLLSQVSHSMSLFLAPAHDRALIKYIHVLPLDSHQAIMVVITETGALDNELMYLGESVSPELLQSLAIQFSNALQNVSIGHVTAEALGSILVHMEGPQGILLILSETLLRAINKRKLFYSVGTTELLNQPEFKSVEKVQPLLSLVEEQNQLGQLLKDDSPTPVKVKIGIENETEALHSMSVVQADFTNQDQPIGTLAILGPTRMEYGRIIVMLSYETYNGNYGKRTKQKGQIMAEEQDIKQETVEETEDTTNVEEPTVEKTEEAVADAAQVLEELKADFDNRYKRLQADFENFKRRTNQEKEQLAGYVKGDVLTDLLPVLDNFERAVQSPAEGEAKVFLDGFIMIHQNLMAMLSKHGLAVIEAVGQPFDPNFHQAIMRVPSDEYESDTVCEVLQTGYTVDGRCIRPAMVKVVE